MEYPHWLMFAGGALVVAGVIGFAFRKRNAKPIESNGPTGEPNSAQARAKGGEGRRNEQTE